MEKSKRYSEASRILSEHGLKQTRTRKAVLELFRASDGALSHSEVQEGLREKVDRVTIYRTLKAFRKKGLIHEVPGPDGVLKYGLCSEECKEGDHKDEHVHFHCRECGNAYCLENVKVPTVQVPEGFFKEEEGYFIRGLCSKCSAYG
jgi:Fur family ferric uptake transcriptional regulator